MSESREMCLHLCYVPYLLYSTPADGDSLHFPDGLVQDFQGYYCMANDDNASLNMDLGLQILNLNNTQPIVNINLFHPSEEANPAPNVNISYSYPSDQAAFMDSVQTTINVNLASPVPQANSSSKVGGLSKKYTTEVEVFNDEQGYQYRFINAGKHVYCRDVLLRCNTSKECSGMACMRNDAILNVGEHDHPPPVKDINPDRDGIDMQLEDGCKSPKRATKRKIEPSPGEEKECTPATVNVNLILNINVPEQGASDPLASEEEEPAPKIPNLGLLEYLPPMFYIPLESINNSEEA